MFRQIITDELEQAIRNAAKDHPRVRKLPDGTYGVKCSKRCVRGTEHVITFEERGDELWYDCHECESERWRIVKVCRHCASALGLYFYYRDLVATQEAGGLGVIS